MSRASPCVVLYFIFVLLTLWRPGETQERCPHDETLTILALVPCYNPTNVSGVSVDRSDRCNYLAYSAARLAAEHWNTHSSVANISVQIKAPKGRKTIPVLLTIGEASRNNVHGVIGPETFAVAQLFSHVVAESLEVPSVLYSLSGHIDDSNLLRRTLPSDLYIVGGLVSLLESFEWYKAGTISITSGQYLEPYEQFVTEFSHYLDEEVHYNLELALSESYMYSDDESLDHILRALVSRDVRIIVAFLMERDAVTVLCKASKVGLTSADHVWILPSYSDPDWWQNNASSSCTEDELLQALESTIFILPAKYPPFTQTNLTSSPEQFREDLFRHTLEIFPYLTVSNLSHLLVHSNAISAYDAVWTISSVWESVIADSYCQNNTTDLTIGLEGALNATLDTEFQHLWTQAGCTGLNDSRDYYGQIIITQFQGGHVCPVAIVLPTGSARERFVKLTDTDTHPCPGVVQLGEWIRTFTDAAANCSFEFKWKDGRSSVPGSGYSLKQSMIPVWAMVLVCLLVVGGIALLISIAVFNFIHRENKFIKAASPNLSVLIIIGFILPLPESIVIGLIYSSKAYGFSPFGVDILCWCHRWLSAFGITLVYATFLVKNYRIYRIFHNKKLEVQQRCFKDLSDGALLVVVFLLLVPAAVVCIVSFFIQRANHLQAIVPLSKDVFSYEFLDITVCFPLHKHIGLAYFLYLNILIFATFIYGILNLRLRNRFGADGRAVLSVTITMFVGTWAYEWIFSEVDPTSYLFIFYASTAYYLLFIMLTAGGVFLPPYYHMFKDHHLNTMLSEQHKEAYLTRERLDHYHYLCSRSVDLKKQLDEIETKLTRLKHTYEKSDTKASEL